MTVLYLVAFIETSKSTAQISGPGLAGGLEQLITAPFAILCTSVSFFVSAVYIARIRKLETVVTDAKKQKSMWLEIKEGLYTVYTKPLLWGVVRCFVRHFGVGPTIVGSATIAASGGLLAPLAVGSELSIALIMMLGQLLFGMGVSMFSISTTSLRQVIVPDALQGRVNATFRFISWGTLPLGSLIGGMIGGQWVYGSLYLRVALDC